MKSYSGAGSPISISRPTITILLALLAVTIATVALTRTSLPAWMQHRVLPAICSAPSLARTPSLRSVTFSEHDQYMSLSHDYDDHWEALLPTNGGFFKQVTAPAAIVDDDDEESGTDSDSHGANGGGEAMRSHGISMFHQLHCLQMIRAEVQALSEENAELKASASPAMRKRVAGSGHGDHGDHDGGDEHDHSGHDHSQSPSPAHAHHHDHADILNNPAHWLHCFDYIRQGILCAADATVEPPTVNRKGKDIIDGNVVEHMCRDPRELYELAASVVVEEGGGHQGHQGHVHNHNHS